MNKFMRKINCQHLECFNIKHSSDLCIRQQDNKRCFSDYFQSEGLKQFASSLKLNLGLTIDQLRYFYQCTLSYDIFATFQLNFFIKSFLTVHKVIALTIFSYCKYYINCQIMQQNISGCFSIKNVKDLLTDRKSTSNFKNFTRLLAYAKNNKRSRTRVNSMQNQSECNSYCVKKNTKLLQIPENCRKSNQYNNNITKSKHFTLNKLNNKHLNQIKLNIFEQLSFERQKTYKTDENQKIQSFFTQVYGKGREKQLQLQIQKQRQRQRFRQRQAQRSPQKINLKFSPQDNYYREAKKRNRYYIMEHTRQKNNNNGMFKKQYNSYMRQKALEKIGTSGNSNNAIKSSRSVEVQKNLNNINISVISPHQNGTVLSSKNIPIIQTVYFSQSPVTIRIKKQTNMDQSNIFKNAVSIHQIRKISKKLFSNQGLTNKQIKLKTQNTEKMQERKHRSRIYTLFNRTDKHKALQNYGNVQNNVFLQIQKEEVICGW